MSASTPAARTLCSIETAAWNARADASSLTLAAGVSSSDQASPFMTGASGVWNGTNNQAFLEIRNEPGTNLPRYRIREQSYNDNQHIFSSQFRCMAMWQP